MKQYNNFGSIGAFTINKEDLKGGMYLVKFVFDDRTVARQLTIVK